MLLGLTANTGLHVFMSSLMRKKLLEYSRLTFKFDSQCTLAEDATTDQEALSLSLPLLNLSLGGRQQLLDVLLGNTS